MNNKGLAYIIQTNELPKNTLQFFQLTQQDIYVLFQTRER